MTDCFDAAGCPLNPYPCSYVPGPSLPPVEQPLEPDTVEVVPEGRLRVDYSIERYVRVRRAACGPSLVGPVLLRL